MAIKPILFNTEMVRAILDGRKTCTRRVIKPQPQSRLCYTYAGSHKGCIGKWTYPNRGAHEFLGEEYKLPENIKDEELSKQWNPPYHTGDILYVRETFIQAAAHTFWYKADDKAWMSKDLLWKPSIRMPKEAARIWLNVTDVRVERLQEITEVGIQKEGVEVDPKECAGKFDFISELFLLFQRLWDSTIKKSDCDRYGWNALPWVWVIEFERCEKPEGV